MNEVKISRQEIISLCRLCLAKDLASIDIFEDGNELRHLYTKIVACLPVQVFANDTLPHKICEVCNAKVDDFYQFWTSTAKNQKQLNDWLQVATDQKVDHASVAVPRIKVEAEERDDYEDYDDGVRADDSDDDEEEASAPKRIKTTHSDTEEDTKPTDLVSSLPDSSDVNGKKKSKEHKLFTDVQDEKSSFSVSKKNKLQCDKCSKHFPNQRSVKRHIQRVHLNPRKAFQCETCMDRFSTASKLQGHVNRAHSNPIDGVDQKPKSNEPLDTGNYTLEEWNVIVKSRSKECPVCQKSYASPRLMRRHLREVHSTQKKYICDICGMQFSSNDRVNSHKKIKHLGIGKIQQRKYECDICKMKFLSKSTISDHMNTHTGYQPYQCPYKPCKRAYGVRKSFKMHLKRHQHLAGELGTEDMSECNICKKKFLQKNMLKKHMDWVHGDKCHVCKICGAKLKGGIQKHMLSHTGEKPYCCHICGKSYKGNLKDHMLTHTGERPYKCDICGRKFKDKWYLGVHKRKHTGEKPYNCDYCDQTFATRPSFTGHLKKHSEYNSGVGKGFGCQICKLRFENDGELSSHYTEHFGENDC